MDIDKNTGNTAHQPILLGMVLLATLLIYMPGLSGNFLFDDHLNIVQNSALHIADLTVDELRDASLSGIAGPLKRPISMLSFSLNDYFFGLDPYYFKLVNVIIHLLNGVGLYFLSHLLLLLSRNSSLHSLSDKQISLVSLGAAALWLLHPLNTTSVLYIVQRMNSLATLFTVCGLIAYCYGRLRLTTSSKGFWIAFSGIALFTPLAILCKETGALLPLYAATIELTLIRFNTFSSKQAPFIKALWSIFGCVLLICLFVLIRSPDFILDSYTSRPFTLTERVLTESRVLSNYLVTVLVPAISRMSLFHDDIVVSTGAFSPLSTAFSIAFISALLAATWLLLKKLPFVSFGILFFFTGHSLESSVLGLELAHEHRNYLPQYGILFGLVFYAATTANKFLGNRGANAVIGILLLVVGGSTYIRNSYWGEHGTHVLIEATHKPQSPRAQLEAGLLYANFGSATDDTKEQSHYYKLAHQHFENSYKARPESTDGLFALIALESKVNKVTPNNYIDELEYRLNKEPFQANSANQIHGLINCKIENRCLVSDNQMGALLQAALDNPTLKGHVKSRVLHEAAKYLYVYVKNYQDAVTLEYQAILAQPSSIISRITLIQMLIALGQTELAKEQFVDLQRVNTLSLHLDTMNSLEDNLYEGE